MFPNNPFFIEKLVKTKQDDILREIQDPNMYEYSIKPKNKYRTWALVGLLIALGWLCSVSF